MSLRFTPLTLNVRELAHTYAIYCLRHDPTSKIYFGSTGDLAARLRQWYYTLENQTRAGNAPARFMNIFLTYGYKPVEQWSYAIVDQTVPAEGYKAGAPPLQRPEWPYVQWALANCPALVLNDPSGLRRGPSKPHGWGPRGMSPIKYLGIKLGIQPGVKHDTQPPHEFRVNPKVLLPVGSPAVPFALYLYRSMRRERPHNMNPSPAAMQALYTVWLAMQPAGYPPKHEARTIHTVQDALDLPDPTY